MTSSFLQHKAGPGCITYDANMAILQIATQIMRDYLEQQKYQTVIAQECADMASTCLVKMGWYELYKAVTDSLIKAAGGAIGIGMAGMCINNSKEAISKLGETNKSLESLEKVRNQMENPVLNPGAQTEAPRVPEDLAAKAKPAPVEGVLDASSATVSTIKPGPGETIVMQEGKLTPIKLSEDQKAAIPRQVEEWCKGDCKEKLSIKLQKSSPEEKESTLESEYLNGIPDDTKAHLRRIFKEHETRLSHIKEQANMAVQKMQMLSQAAGPLTQIIEGIGGASSTWFALTRSRYEAAKTEIQQSQEFIKQVDGINSQGAQQAFDQAQKALQAYMSVVSANTRA